MNCLLGYGSDDDCEDSSEEKTTDWRGSSSKESKDKKENCSRPNDANYEEVHMDLSEGSNDSKPETKERKSRERDSSKRRSRDRRDYRSSRRSRRSSSRERRRSRTPSRRSERESRYSRSRSRSRDRVRKYSKRYDRDRKEQTERNDRNKNEDKRSSDDRFFMPGISGRFRDQIERRKQLWQKKDDDNKNGQSKKVWETTTFAQDADGKVASKFKRLMGIKNTTENSTQGVDVLRKQEEMFSSMEQQYEVARTATHTMRGVGLGFGSYQR